MRRYRRSVVVKMRSPVQARKAEQGGQLQAGEAGQAERARHAYSMYELGRVSEVQY